MCGLYYFFLKKFQKHKDIEFRFVIKNEELKRKPYDV